MRKSREMWKSIGKILWHPNSSIYGRNLWILLAAILAVLAFVRPTKRTVCYHYSWATTKWWAKEKLYTAGGHGFLYFPQSVHVYTPFVWQKWPRNMPEFNKKPFSETVKSHFRLRLGEGFYRICLVGFFGYALYQLSSTIRGRDGPLNAFFVISLLSLPSVVTAAANGQFNTLLSATMILAAVSATREKWNMVMVWLIAGMVIKPLGIVPLLLFGAIYRPLWPRVPIGLLVFALLGFLHYDLSYALEQWKSCVEKLQIASVPPADTFDDIASMFRVFGISVSQDVWFYVRLVFAPIFLLTAYLLTRKTDAWLGPILVAACAATYLMLFNPRNETVSFQVLAPYVAALAAVTFRSGTKSIFTWVLVFLCIGWGSDNYGDFYKISRLWWKPLLAFVFMVILFVWAFLKVSFVDRSLPENH